MRSKLGAIQPQRPAGKVSVQHIRSLKAKYSEEILVSQPFIISQLTDNASRIAFLEAVSKQEVRQNYFKHPRASSIAQWAAIPRLNFKSSGRHSAPSQCNVRFYSSPRRGLNLEFNTFCRMPRLKSFWVKTVYRWMAEAILGEDSLPLNGRRIMNFKTRYF